MGKASSFRVIPGYEWYSVNEDGVIVSTVRGIVLSQYELNGYMIVDTFRGSLTETLPVHRAVALAWVPNPEPLLFTVVNHLDGNPLNNHKDNLEWTTVSGNNYHAVNTGLRNDNIRCSIRDFDTGEVLEFNSIAQAAEYMGMSKATPYHVLRPKKIGSLIKDKYEFRYADEETPWFYETIKERIEPSRYWVVAEEPDGTVVNLFSHKKILQRYQLYASPSHSVPALVEYARQKYPDIKFTLHDGYNDAQHRVNRTTKLSVAQPVVAKRDGEEIRFSSLTQAAKHFKVDRSKVVNRIRKGDELDGWTFT